MMIGLKKQARPVIAAAAICVPALLLQGCYEEDYLSRRDTISLGAGDAAATNAAIQTVDPWPPYAKNTDIHLEGERAGVAVERYQKNKSIPPRGLNTTEITGQAGPGAQGNTQIRD